MGNKRLHERYVAEYQRGFATKLILTYELMDEGIADGVQLHREGLATILNISKGGCYIHCHAPLPSETRLLVTMTPPARPDDKITVIGKIIRQATGASDDYYCGIQFIEFRDNSQTNLEKFVERLGTENASKNDDG